MEMLNFIVKTIILLVFIVSPNVLSSQTYLYKRVAIVKNGNKRTVNDDAHYITFNKNGCYESDSQGYALGKGLIKFRKNENNLHCYYGQGEYGMSHYYFSQNYSRLNIKTDEEIFVYEREASGKTKASTRKIENSSNGNTIVAPPPLLLDSNGSSSNSNSQSNKKQSEYGYVDCPQCYGSGCCPSCNGKGWDYSTYTQNPKTCPICQGRKKCTTCQGSGKSYRRIR